MGKLRVLKGLQIYRKDWTVYDGVSIPCNLVAHVFYNSGGLTIYRYKKEYSGDQIVGDLGLDYVIMYRQIYDLELVEEPPPEL
jgi:hypothetical protein